MSKKQSTYPADGLQARIQEVQTQHSFDKEAFLNAVKDQGVTFEHYRAIGDPTGMASLGDAHAVQTGHVRTNSDGFIYVKVGEVRALFTTNTTNENARPEGVINFSTAYATFPEHYDNVPNEKIYLAPWDRLFLKDVETTTIGRQFVEASQDGVDKLQYPAFEIEYVRDARGIVYQSNVDFRLTEHGDIQWISQNQPGWNPKLNRGTVYSVRYKYRGFYIVSRLMHEIRVANITDLMTFERRTERMPYQVQIVRENVFRDKNSDPGDPDGGSQRSDYRPQPNGFPPIDPSGKLGPPT